MGVGKKAHQRPRQVVVKASPPLLITYDNDGHSVWIMLGKNPPARPNTSLQDRLAPRELAARRDPASPT